MTGGSWPAGDRCAWNPGKFTLGQHRYLSRIHRHAHPGAARAAAPSREHRGTHAGPPGARSRDERTARLRGPLRARRTRSARAALGAARDFRSTGASDVAFRAVERVHESRRRLAGTACRLRSQSRERTGTRSQPGLPRPQAGSGRRDRRLHDGSRSRCRTLHVLDDDRKFFPSYQAVWLYRLESARRWPATCR